MSGRGPGLTLVIMGIGLVVAGLVLWSGGLTWFGPRTHLYMPIASMVVVSLVLSLLAWIFRQR